MGKVCVNTLSGRLDYLGSYTSLSPETKREKNSRTLRKERNLNVASGFGGHHPARPRGVHGTAGQGPRAGDVSRCDTCTRKQGDTGCNDTGIRIVESVSCSGSPRAPRSTRAERTAEGVGRSSSSATATATGLRLFHHPERNPIPVSGHSPSLRARPLVATALSPVSTDLHLLDVSCRENRTTHCSLRVLPLPGHLEGSGLIRVTARVRTPFLPTAGLRAQHGGAQHGGRVRSVCPPSRC